MFGVTQLNASSCLFLILLMLSFALSVTNVVDENNSQVLPVTTLVVNCAVLFTNSFTNIWSKSTFQIR